MTDHRKRNTHREPNGKLKDSITNQADRTYSTGQQEVSTMSIGQFADSSGVSQRTLRYYEQMGLLQPRHVTPAGRRYYSQEDLIPLQQIIALKYLGYSLEEIKELLHREPSDLKASLSFQRELMIQKRDRLNQMIKAMDHSLEVLEAKEELNPQIISYLIHSILHEKEHLEWVKAYLPEPLMSHVLDHYQEKELEWNRRSALLFDQVKAALVNHPPESPQVQSPIEELMELVTDMFGDNWKLSELQQVADQVDALNLPSTFTSPFTPQEEQLLNEAIAIYFTNKEEMTSHGQLEPRS